MTDADDHALDTEAMLERLLAGEPPDPHAPAWCGDVALLVRAAQAPAQPDELAAEADIVRRMADVLAATTGADNATTAPAPAADPAAGSPPPASPLPDLVLVAEPDAANPVPVAAAAGPSGADSDATTPVPAVAAAVAPTSPAGDPATGITDLAGYRAKHATDRNYRAKHAAARMQRSRHPAVRTLGRAIAMKAAAATTAVVIGAAAAAAATTGIVATVVVPALTQDSPRQPSGSPPTTERAPRPGDVGARSGDDPSSPGQPSTAECPEPAACTATTLAGLPANGASTTVPATTGTTGPAAGATSTLADPGAPTTVPGLPTTVVEPPPTTVVTDPPQVEALSTAAPVTP